MAVTPKKRSEAVDLKNFFERHRQGLSWAITLPMLAYLVMAPIHEDSLLGSLMEYSGFTLLIIATLGRIWSTLFICGRKDTRLVDDGPFSLCRNPLYLFSFIGAIGFMLAAQNLLLSALIIPVFWTYYHFVIRGEEKRLSLIFGQSYINYCKNTPRLFPKFSRYHSREVVDLDLRIMTRSMLDSSCFLFLIVIIEVLEQIKSI